MALQSTYFTEIIYTTAFYVESSIRITLYFLDKFKYNGDTMGVPKCNISKNTLWQTKCYENLVNGIISVTKKYQTVAITHLANDENFGDTQEKYPKWDSLNIFILINPSVLIYSVLYHGEVSRISMCTLALENSNTKTIRLGKNSPSVWTE